MRSLRNVLVLGVFCLTLGATAVSAAERPAGVAGGREVDGMARILSRVQALLSVVWEKAAWEIDPFGRCSPAGPTQDDPGSPGADEAFDIDPLG
jgi:hypothetical protein